jgi:hypothetical protein
LVYFGAKIGIGILREDDGRVNFSGFTKSISEQPANGCGEFTLDSLLTTQKKSQISQEDYPNEITK